jgi:putative transposase
MGRPVRPTAANVVYHVLNRANARMTLFDVDGDYAAYQRVLTEACARVSMRLLAYCIMPNHWHLVVWPRHDGDLSRFMNWLTLTHTQRWHQHRHMVGEGHVYQGRFKSFPVETSEYFLTLCRYVERNPVRAGLVERVERWRWSSAGANGTVPLHEWPMARPRDWCNWVNESEPTEQLSMVRQSLLKGQPYGSARWVEQMVTQWNLGATLRGRGRPKKEEANNGS